MTQTNREAYLEESLSIQKETVFLFPHDIISRNSLAETLRELGRFDEAITVLQETIKIFPNNVVAYNMLAECASQTGRIDVALSLYEDTIRLNPQDVVARNGKAEILRQDGRVEKAIQVLEETVQQFPHDIVSSLLLADTLLRAQRLDESISIYRRIFTEFPANPVARNGLAESLRRKATEKESAYSTTHNNIYATTHYRYQVALSFAGEDRPIALDIASRLRERGVSVFYDDYEQADLWGKDLYQHLAKVYAEDAQFCIVLISAHYVDKLWTRHELKQAQTRAFKESREYLLPVRLDDTKIPGINDMIGYIDLRFRSVEVLVQVVLKKLAMGGQMS
jgi:predicted Zn-dependent protease